LFILKNIPFKLEVLENHFNFGPTPKQQHCYHHAPAVKPEVATAVVELLMMGVRTPEIC